MVSIDEKRPVSGAIAGWDQQFQSFGKVIIPQKMSKMILTFELVMAGAAIGLFGGYRSSGGDTTTLLWVAGIFIPLILLLFAVPLLLNRKKTIVVETDGVRLTNKMLVPWSEILDTDIWSYRGNTMVTLKVTDTYMREYLATLPAAARMLTKVNSAMGRGNTLYLPGLLDAKPEELRDWLAMLLDRQQTSKSAFWNDAAFA